MSPAGLVPLKQHGFMGIGRKVVLLLHMSHLHVYRFNPFSFLRVMHTLIEFVKA